MAKLEGDKISEQDPKKNATLPGLGAHSLKEVQEAGKDMSASSKGSSPVFVIERNFSPPAPGKQQPPIGQEQGAVLSDQERDAARLKELTEKKKHDGKLDDWDQGELDGLLLERKRANLEQQRRGGTISKEDNALLVGYGEFPQPWVPEEVRGLVAQEVLGTIKKEGRAKLASWREFGDSDESVTTNQSGEVISRDKVLKNQTQEYARKLVEKSFLAHSTKKAKPN